MKRSGATGKELKEACNINGGLLALGNVIVALATESENKKEAKKGHIPYRCSAVHCFELHPLQACFEAVCSVRFYGMVQCRVCFWVDFAPHCGVSAIAVHFGEIWCHSFWLKEQRGPCSRARPARKLRLVESKAPLVTFTLPQQPPRCTENTCSSRAHDVQAHQAACAGVRVCVSIQGSAHAHKYQLCAPSLAHRNHSWHVHA